MAVNHPVEIYPLTGESYLFRTWDYDGHVIDAVGTLSDDAEDLVDLHTSNWSTPERARRMPVLVQKIRAMTRQDLLERLRHPLKLE